MKQASLFSILLSILFCACVPVTTSSRTVTVNETLDISLTQSLTSTYTPEPTLIPTSTPKPTFTSTPILRDITFFAFHDYNGNGEWDKDSDEPLLPNITINTEGQSCTTTEDGKCLLSNIHIGDFEYTVSDPSEKFIWILPSVWESIKIGDSIGVFFDQVTSINIPLAEGRYILPFPKDTIYEIFTWYDRDKNEKQVLNWFGETDNSPGQHGDYYYSFEVRVEDGHCAIDYVFQEDIPVIASDAGVVTEIIQDTRPEVPYDHIVIILNNENVRLNYGHVNILDGLNVGDEVHRGEVIGYATPHSYPRDHEPVFRGFKYMIHQGFEPIGMASHCDALDPFLPSLWTVSDYNLARVNIDKK